MIKEIKTLFFKCDMCHTHLLLRDVYEGTLPAGWTSAILYAVQDGYGGAFSLKEFANFGNTEHYCEQCSHKREVREVFK
jgi:hypothetical protein